MAAMQRLSERVAIVTGGAQGIGGETARRLAEEGARVLVVDMDAERARDNAERIRGARGQAADFAADVGTEAGVRDTIARAVSEFGRVDIVVNNAYSGPGRKPLEDLAEADWDRGMDVGLKSMFRAAKYASP